MTATCSSAAIAAAAPWSRACGRKDDEDWVDWRGAKASDLLVVSLAACSAYDVVDILLKQRQGLTGL